MLVGSGRGGREGLSKDACGKPEGREGGAIKRCHRSPQTLTFSPDLQQHDLRFPPRSIVIPLSRRPFTIVSRSPAHWYHSHHDIVLWQKKHFVSLNFAISITMKLSLAIGVMFTLSNRCQQLAIPCINFHCRWPVTFYTTTTCDFSIGAVFSLACLERCSPTLL